MRIPRSPSTNGDRSHRYCRQPTTQASGARDDRLYVSAFYYAEATRSSLESLPAAYGNPRSLRTRRQRWERDGTLSKLMEAGAPVIDRMGPAI